MTAAPSGARSLIAAAAEGGIEVCFANPGTTELPLVVALDSEPRIRPILCLHENVATGAADGYARMTGKPALCLLHLGPGLANGLTNLHNARRARTPLLNVVGEHATWHIAADPPLATRIEDVARPFTDWFKVASDAGSVAADIREAQARSGDAGGAVATLVVPNDVQAAAAPAAGAIAAPRFASAPLGTIAPNAVDRAAEALKAGRGALLLGSDALSEAGLRLAGRISAKTGAELLTETFFARMERGGDLPRAMRLPYFPEPALELTRRFATVVVVGTRRPVAFFGYEGRPSHLTTERQTLMLADARQDALAALVMLADALDAREDGPASEPGMPPAMPRGPLTAETVSAVIARLQPADAIVMDEALTVGTPYFAASHSAPRFTHLLLTGGAIGQGPGAATGAAVACPGRKVVNFQSDGCGAYSVQAFWTQAREALDVVTVIGSNRSYHILNVELQRAGVKAPGPASRAFASLDRPHLDWVRIGEGFGVPSVAVETAEALARELERALAARGPRLIEAVMTT